MRSRSTRARTPVTRIVFAQIYPSGWTKVIERTVGDAITEPWDEVRTQIALQEKGPPQSRGSVLRGWDHSEGGSRDGPGPAGTGCFE